MASTATERVRKMRLRRRRAGLCEACGLIPRELGSSSCAACKAEGRGRYAALSAERIAAGLCTGCGLIKPLPGQRWCAACCGDERDYHNERKGGAP